MRFLFSVLLFCCLWLSGCVCVFSFSFVVCLCLGFVIEVCACRLVVMMCVFVVLCLFVCFCLFCLRVLEVCD